MVGRGGNATLEDQLQGRKNINELMAPYFPGKTARQIRSKRSDKSRRLKRQAMREDRQHWPIHQQRDNENNPDLTLKLDEDIFRSAAFEDAETDGGSGEWKRWLAVSAVRTFHKHRDSLTRAERDLGEALERVALAARADPSLPVETLTTLETAISKTAELAAKHPLREKKGCTHDQRRRGKNNRIARRKRNYARLQELAKHDMKSLANIVANDRMDELEEPQSPLPPTGDIQDLYHLLWGT